MTVKFFNLFFIKDYKFTDADINILQCVSAPSLFTPPPPPPLLCSVVVRCVVNAPGGSSTTSSLPVASPTALRKLQKMDIATAARGCTPPIR